MSHVQTVLDEYDYAVSNLTSDLRDGLKLTYVPTVVDPVFMKEEIYTVFINSFSPEVV